MNVSTHHAESGAGGERLDLKEHAWPLYVTSWLLALIGLVGAAALGAMEQDGFRRFLFAYLGGYCFFLTISLGGLFFVLLQHLTKAGWSVNVRRIAEWTAAAMPIMAVLSAPIIVSIILGAVSGHGSLFTWTDPKVRADFPWFRKFYLNPTFLVARLVFCFVVWSWMGVWFWKQSIKQDHNGDYRLTERMQSVSAPCMVVFGLTLTSTSFDLLMSLDPGWASTIFGVYVFGGSCLAIFSVLILTVLYLQSRGLMLQSVTEEHFHDLGKLLFAFVFFWGYIAFSQYMLYWYGNIPDETEWYRRRGATTAGADVNGYSVVILLLLFGHFLIPFGGLLSRHVKRSRLALGFWAVWILCFHWLDLFWIIRPEYNRAFDFGLIDFAVLIGVGGVFMVVVLRKAAHDSLRPLKDPRLADSLAFENF
jgi:hypothetical protein